MHCTNTAGECLNPNWRLAQGWTKSQDRNTPNFGKFWFQCEFHDCPISLLWTELKPRTWTLEVSFCAHSLNPICANNSFHCNFQKDENISIDIRLCENLSFMKPTVNIPCQLPGSVPLRSVGATFSFAFVEDSSISCVLILRVAMFWANSIKMLKWYKTCFFIVKFMPCFVVGYSLIYFILLQESQTNLNYLLMVKKKISFKENNKCSRERPHSRSLHRVSVFSLKIFWKKVLHF